MTNTMLDAPPCTPPTPLALAACHRALVVVPHPDDEAIGCGALLARLHQLGIATRVVLASDGSGAGELPDGTAARRQAEFMASLGTLGTHLEAHLWQLPDGQLAAHEAQIEAYIEQAVNAFEATLLVAPWPADMHPDHAALGRAALAHHCRQPLLQGILLFEVWSPLPATHVLEASREWPLKQAALQCHATALACGDYAQAMEGLARYRSLLLPGNASGYAEAYYGVDTHALETGELTPNPQHISQAEPPFGATGMQFRFALADDGDDVAALFSQVFDTPLPPGWWAWKYGNEPFAGSIARNAAGDAVGFYGAQARKARWQGQRMTVSQQGDVMVAPGYRFATRHQGVFASLGRHFLHRHVGQDLTFALSYGFPTPRALALGCHLGLYQHGDAIQEWHTPASTRRLALGASMQLMAAATLNDWRWLRALNALPPGANACLHLLRTPEHWQSRFGQHPEAQYEVVQLRLWGRLCGAAILRSRQQTLEVVDVALRQPRHWSRLMAAIHQTALALGHSVLMAFGTTNALASFPGGERHPAGHLALPGPALNTPLSQAVKGHCWLLGGDTDFR